MKKKLSLIILVLSVVLVFGVSYLVLSSNKTTKAVVLNTAVEPGVVITEDMITVLDIPAKTPEGYLKNVQSVIGYKSKTRIEKDQLLYTSNFMSSWTNYSDSENIPEDYGITSISIPDAQACGGVITAGDYVDIFAVYEVSPDMGTNAYNIPGTELPSLPVTYIASNVYILNTNSSLAQAQESDTSVSSEEESGDSGEPTYIFALSYDDIKKLQSVYNMEDVKIYMNIAPAQNQVEGNSPLIKQMIGQSKSYLHDSQVQVQDKDGNMLSEAFPYEESESESNYTYIEPEIKDETEDVTEDESIFGGSEEISEDEEIIE